MAITETRGQHVMLILTSFLMTSRIDVTSQFIRSFYSQDGGAIFKRTTRKHQILRPIGQKQKRNAISIEDSVQGQMSVESNRISMVRQVFYLPGVTG